MSDEVKMCPTCSFHREEVLERKNQKEDLVALDHNVVELFKRIAILETTSAIMANDMGYIKKPLSVVAVAVILYVAGALLKVIPYVTKMGVPSP